MNKYTKLSDLELRLVRLWDKIELADSNGQFNRVEMLLQLTDKIEHFITIEQNKENRR